MDKEDNNKQICIVQDCGRECYGERFCIFHIPKDHRCVEFSNGKIISTVKEDYNTAIEELFKNKLSKQDEDLDFYGFKFIDFNISNMEIPNKCIFKNASFTGKTVFSDIVFKNECRFERCSFINNACIFEHVTFEKELHLRDINFEHNITFLSTTFGNRVNFRNIIIKGGSFYDCKFKDEAFFGGTEFLDTPVHFEDIRFFGKTNFRLCRFDKEIKFINMKFKNTVDFTGTEFNNDAEFIWTEFHKKANFEKVKFLKGIKFWESKFLDTSCFYEASFYGNTYFIGDYNNHIFNSILNFRSVTLPTNNDVRFEFANFSKATFLDTSLTNIHFRNVKWYKPIIDISFRSIALWDEFRKLEKSNILTSDMDTGDSKRHYYKIAENYTDLLNNFENKRDFITANQFYIGEMEIRRKSRSDKILEMPNSLLNLSFEDEKQYKIVKRFKQLGSRFKRLFIRKRSIVNFYNISFVGYSLLSNYGTNPFLALGWLLLFVFFLFPCIFMWSGFTSTPQTPFDPVFIDYVFSFNPMEVFRSLPKVLNDYPTALSYSLSILSFQKNSFYLPVSIFSQFTSSLAIIVFYSQFSLLILAIKRFFKR